ncbi:EspA/EspE family type VII secretion system effector [Mycobacterium sp. ITM-2016-00317]|uniref:EspA/EspE family type VII secretion system effector n=1 Tax=Mycobacterium sp. ITM-2016-00317 TaxID=2099694 RepID=UPI00287F8C88|nr:EspA/EspE family type VII secretion system effector [Mycobacterium sp. ITM-2016-00317]WNG88200.1 EspA/EspE family type VII secretion system effector [Mycobacterium sp. ITM-2016-00317]
MSLFDFYSDLMQRVGESMQRADPVGPIGTAGEAITSLFAVGDIAADLGPDAVWNLAGDFGDVASVAQGLLPLATRTLIIEGGLKMVTVMEDQCGGANIPTEGDTYSESAQRFNQVGETLDSAMPDHRWRGEASQAYQEANEQQLARVRKIVDADLKVRMALSAEAGEVRAARRAFNEAATVMGNAIVPALAARALGKHGKAVAHAIETAAVAAAMPICIWHMTQLTAHSTRAAATLMDAVALYDQVARDGYPIRM